MIRKAIESDLKAIDIIAVEAIKLMSKQNLEQWDLTYPRYEHFAKDIEDDALFVFEVEGDIAGVMVLHDENEEAYKELSNWQGARSLVIHRIIVNSKYRKQGIGRKFLRFAEKRAVTFQYQAIKTDTHIDNVAMFTLLQQEKYIFKGFLRSINRIAFEKIICL